VAPVSISAVVLVPVVIVACWWRCNLAVTSMVASMKLLDVELG